MARQGFLFFLLLIYKLNRVDGVSSHCHRELSIGILEQYNYFIDSLSERPKKSDPNGSPHTTLISVERTEKKKINKKKRERRELKLQALHIGRLKITENLPFLNSFETYFWSAYFWIFHFFQRSCRISSGLEKVCALAEKSNTEQ